MSPNVISFSAAVAACAKGGLWNEALALLEQMRQVIATDCGLIAIDYEALTLLEQMHQVIALDCD